MQAAELETLFDRQAQTYDQQWARLAPINDALHLLVSAVFADLPADARILCVGAGTGTEILALAARFPGFRFTAVEPSAAMIEVCRLRLHERGIGSRCEFHKGYLASLPPSEAFDAATAFLVSQFILESQQRSAFFREMALRLRPGGRLAVTDLSCDIASAQYQSLLDVWMRMMSAAQVSPDMRERMRNAYAQDVAVLAPERVAAIITNGGFARPVPFFQAGLIHGWYATRAERLADAQ